MDKFRMKISAAIGITFSLIMMNANATENSSIMYPHENWAGAYFGLHFGSGAGDVNTSMHRTQYFADTVFDPGATFIQTSSTTGNANLSGNASGSTADLYIGYNFHFNALSNFIFGGQLEGTFFSDITLYSKGVELLTNSQMQATLPGDIVSNTSGVADDITEYSDELQSMFTFLVRAGYLIRPNLLIYILGGGAEGNFVLPGGEIFGTQRNVWELGYTAGVGLEYRFNNNWSLQGEYRFIHFDINRNVLDPSLSVTLNGPEEVRVDQSSFSQSFNTDFNFNMGKIGIVYRFDSPQLPFK